MDDRPTRLPSQRQAELAIAKARRMALDPQTYPGAPGELHLHYHEAPAAIAAASPAPAPRDDAGWALLNRLVPYMVLAGYLVLIITGCAVVLAWALGFLVVLIHSLLALVVAGIGVVGAVAVLLAVIKAPTVWIKGDNNKVSSGVRTGSKDR
jgi:hypothetical protein